MNLYIFNESSRAAVYGIGTYMRELTTALRDCHINVCVVNLMHDISRVTVNYIDGTKHLSFPAPIPSIKVLGSKKQYDQYYRNIVYLLKLYIVDNKDLIFHLNYHKSGALAEALKATFDCKILEVVHYFNFMISIYDNIESSTNLPPDKQPETTIYDSEMIDEEKNYYQKADRIVCLSKFVYETILQYFEIEPEKLMIVPSGLTDPPLSKVNRTILRKKWNLPTNEKIILFVGRVDKIKGLSYLINSFRELLLIYPKCRLVIVGGGSFDVYTQESQDICARIIYTGILNKSDLYEWYQMADVGIMPSLLETFGFVTVEMMMHGLPIVITETSGSDEIVDETCGLKIPLIKTHGRVEMDTTLLSEKILFLLQKPDKARQMGQNGRKKFLKDYSSDVFRRNMINVYESLKNENVINTKK